MRWAWFFLAGVLVAQEPEELASSQEQPEQECEQCSSVITWDGEDWKGRPATFVAPASPQVEGVCAILQTDFIYWLAREDGLEYNLQSSANYSFGVMANIAVAEPNFQWDPGWKILLGTRSGHDSWELKALWTHLWTQAKGLSEVPGGQGTLNHGVWNDGFGLVESLNSTSIAATWGLHYNTLDGGYSRSYFLTKNLSTNISLGATGVWIDQTFDVAELNVTPVSGSYALIPTEQELKTQFQSSYQAAGLFLRFSPEWHWSDSWSLIGSAAGYLVHGTFDLEQKWTVYQFPTGELGLKRHLQRTRSSLQAMLGLQWQSDPSSKDWHVAICLQYEGMIWFKQNLFSQINTSFAENYERRGDLELQGGVFSMRIDF